MQFVSMTQTAITNLGQTSPYLTKKIIYYLSLLFCFAYTTQVMEAKGREYIVDTKKSEITWEGKKVTGTHNGLVNIQDAKIIKKGKTFSGTIIIDMTSITCLDIKDPDYNRKLVSHLKSVDFFNTEKHRTAVLQIISTKKKKNDYYIVKAKITIKGISRKIDFTAKIQNFHKKKVIVAKGKLKIDRTKFGIRYKSGKFFKSLGDKLIYDDFILTFQVSAVIR